jgi:hypothetical protein
VAKREAGEWKFSTLQVAVNGQDERIDLLGLRPEQRV